MPVSPISLSVQPPLEGSFEDYFLGVYDVVPDPGVWCLSYCDSVRGKPWALLKQVVCSEHRSVYRKSFEALLMVCRLRLWS